MTTKLDFTRELKLPLEVVTSKLAFIGQSGSGKTYAALKLAELMLEHGQQIIWCDVPGVADGLRSSASGKAAGFDILLVGGPHGDLPINANAGAVIANLVCDQGLSVILNTSELDDEGMLRFYIGFFRTLFQRAKRDRKPRHVFIDEAQELVPQEYSSKLQVELLAVMRSWMKIGRVHGLGWSVIGQEPQVINKRMLGQAVILVLVRMSGEPERKALEKTVRSKRASKADLELMDVLPELKTGTALLWSPGELAFAGIVHLQPRVTFDSSATPQVGKAKPQAKVRAKLDLDKLRDSVAGLVEEAAAKDPDLLLRRAVTAENDARALRAKLEMVKAPAAPRAIVQDNVPTFAPLVAPKDLQRLERAVEKGGVLSAAFSKEAADLQERMHAAGVALAERIAAAFAPLVEIGKRFAAYEAEAKKPAVLTIKTPQEWKSMLGNSAPPAPSKIGLLASHPSKMVQQVARMAAGEPQEPQDALVKGEREILEALAQLGGSGGQRQVASIVGVKYGGSTWRAYSAHLVRANLMVKSGGDAALTPMGTALVGHVTPDMHQTPDQVQAKWMEKLVAGERAILQQLLTAYPSGVDPRQLAEHLAMKLGGSTWRAYTAHLARLGLMDRKAGLLVASPTLFPGRAA